MWEGWIITSSLRTSCIVCTGRIGLVKALALDWGIERGWQVDLGLADWSINVDVWLTNWSVVGECGGSAENLSYLSNRPLLRHFGRSPIVLVPSALCETSVWVDFDWQGLVMNWQSGEELVLHIVQSCEMSVPLISARLTVPVMRLAKNWKYIDWWVECWYPVLSVGYQFDCHGIDRS